MSSRVMKYIFCVCVLAWLVVGGCAQDLSDRVDDDGPTLASDSNAPTMPRPLTAFYSFEERRAKYLILCGVLSILAARTLYYLQDSKTRNKTDQRLRVASLFAPVAEREALQQQRQKLVLEDRFPFRYAIGAQTCGRMCAR